MTRPKSRTRRHAGAIRKLPSERYQARVRHPITNELVTLGTFPSKADADSAVADAQALQRRGTWVDPRRSQTNFSAWAQQWMEANLNARPRTRQRYEQIVRCHLEPALGKAPLGSITPLNVQQLVRVWTKEYKPNTVRHHYAVLRSILNAAVDADLLGRSPCRGVKLPMVRLAEHHVVTPEELARLADEIGEEYRALVYTGAILGLRFSELAGLRVGRLDLLRGTVTVAEGLVESKGQLVSGPPKSAAGRRALSIPRALTAILAEHLARRGMTGASQEAFVFTSPTGQPLRYSNFRSIVWVRACVAAGLGQLDVLPSGKSTYVGLQIHDLRRAAATAMVASGVDVRTAQNRLGHSDPRLTIGLYAQVTGDADRAAAERLGDHFLSGPAQAEDDAANES
jgi:integrase